MGRGMAPRMTLARPANAATLPQARTRVGNGSSLFIEDIDERSTPARRYREILNQIVADRGGDLSEAQTIIARRAVEMTIWAEGKAAQLVSGIDIDITEFSKVSNAIRRLLESLGLDRRAIDVDQHLGRYLASQQPSVPSPADDTADDEP